MSSIYCGHLHTPISPMGKVACATCNQKKGGQLWNNYYYTHHPMTQRQRGFILMTMPSINKNLKPIKTIMSSPHVMYQILIEFLAQVVSF